MITLSPSFSEFELSPTLGANEMVVAKRAAGEDVYHMGFGQSPFPVPERLRRALADATHAQAYFPTAGYPELVSAVRLYYRDRLDFDMDQYEVMVTPGSKLGLFGLQMAVDGDLLMPVPSWVSYDPQAKMLGTQVIKVQTDLDDEGYHLSVESLRTAVDGARQAGLNPRKLILNYPSNPTGLTISDVELKAIAEYCVAEDILIISDEIYGMVDFEGQYRSISKYAPSHVAVTTGLSKHLSLGGWRVGVVFVPKAVKGLYSRMCQIASETWSSVSSPIQVAVIEAYCGHEDIEQHVRECTNIHAYMNRFIGRRLRACGIDVPMPQGAFYLYPNFGDYRDALAELNVKTSLELGAYLLEHYNLATLPGVAFGEDVDVLTLRLSGVDYDGAEVLDAYRRGEVLDDAFVENYAPRVVEAVKVFERLVETLRGG